MGVVGGSGASGSGIEVQGSWVKEIKFPWELANVFKSQRTQITLTTSGQIVAKSNPNRVAISFASSTTANAHLDTVNGSGGNQGWVITNSSGLQVFTIRMFPTMVLNEIWGWCEASTLVLDVYEEIRLI